MQRTIPKVINVGIGEIAVGDASQVLQAIGVGSCIALIMYDPKIKIGGMAHIMLPKRQLQPNKDLFTDAGSAIPELIHRLQRKGADKTQLVAKFFGGSTMFQRNTLVQQASIGQRNAEVVQTLLDTHHIPVKAKDVGGERGRTVIFEVEGLKSIVSTTFGDQKEF